MGVAPAAISATACLERRQAAARLQRVPTVVAHHLARDLVRQQRQIQESHGRPHVGQIPHPDLIGLAHRQTLDPVAEHRQRVLGVGCAGILRRLGLQQQTLLAQHLQKPVPPQPHPFLGQLPFEHKVQLARAQARLELPFRHHQRRHQLGIHLPTLPRLAPGVIILTGDPHLAANRTDRYPKTPAFQLYGLMPGWPAAFFLNPATSVIPARRQARRVYARSNAESMFASARALFNCLTLALSRLSSLISPGLSTRITFPLVPLPYCRTQRDTVPLPLMPYFMEMSSNAIPPISSSRTTSILRASLYRISSRLPCFFVFMPDNLCQDGTAFSPPSILPFPLRLWLLASLR